MEHILVVGSSYGKLMISDHLHKNVKVLKCFLANHVKFIEII